MSGFGYQVVVSSLHDPADVGRVLGGALDVMLAAGGEPWGPDELGRAEPFALVVGTGGTEHLVLDAWAARTAGRRAGAALLVTHPAHNSLPAALEALARLHQDGQRGRIVHLAGVDHDADVAALRTAVDDLRAWGDLVDTRLGLVGDPSDWLVASAPAPTTVAARWGPTVVPVPISDLVARTREVPWRAVRSLAADLMVASDGLDEPQPPTLVDASRVYPALRALADEHRLDALSVRCFDLVTELRTSGCIALAQCNDERLVAGCEGDLVSTIAMIWAERLLDQVPWMANPATVDPAAGTLALAHCTVPRSIVDGYRLRSHFESGEGVGIEGHIPLGPVTLVRIGGRHLDQVWLAEGQIVADGADPHRCRTQILVRLDRGGTVDDLLRRPLGNHLVVVPGAHLDRLRGWWELFVAPQEHDEALADTERRVARASDPMPVPPSGWC
ncbi:MAG TPA: hypothetical protein VK866_16045 [Acidimicrobiales bacterium]|nr:hypothetical protein [Acidimicrobiales bacterium]